MLQSHHPTRHERKRDEGLPHPDACRAVNEVDKEKTEQEKAQETLCSGTACDHVVSKENISGGVATCDLCDTKTCTTCERKAHKGLCSEDDDTKILTATAGKVMWQQCTICKNLVELDTGYFHIM